MSMSSRCVNKPIDCPLFNRSLRAYLICVYVFVHVFVFIYNVQQTLAHNSSQVSTCLRWCFPSQTRHLFRFPELLEPDGCSLFTSLSCSNNWIFGLWLRFVGSLHHLQQLLNPVLSSNCLSKEIFGGSRGDAKTFSKMIAPVSIMMAFGIQ